LLPTGGGKSICFQVPAIALDGVCIVISPLIALMKDQVRNLVKNDIKAVAVTSALSSREIDIALDNCIYGEVKFLYISPERLTTDLFKERLKKMKVGLIAVDEAHCISQWGYDFRPPYLKIAKIREVIKNVPIIALTATATPEVVIDIQEKLGFKHQNVFQKSFERSNISYSVLYESNKYFKLDEILQKVKGTAIIYARNRRQTQDITKYLKSKGHSADFYHAGLTNAQRDKAQKLWIDGVTRVIVATNAFGMGIDKPDVRLVVHLDLPDSLEAYFQEAGRAGRDEKKAYATLLFDEADEHVLREKHIADFPEIEVIRNTYLALGNYYQLAIGSGKNETFVFDISDFCNKYKLKPTECFSALKILQLNEYISLSDALLSPSKIMVKVSNDVLYNFQLKNPRFEKLLQILMRSYSGIFEVITKIDEQLIAKRLNTNASEITALLTELKTLELIDYEPKTDLPKITYIAERKDHKNLHISPESYQIRKRQAEKKIDAMVNYCIKKDTCRSRLLLNYFGEITEKTCGICDVCTGRNDTSKYNKDVVRAEKKILKTLTNCESLTLSDLVMQLSDEKKSLIIEALRFMMDEKKIKHDKGRYFL
jgi:ATP-dependent DNA helicase RecQ